MLKKIISIFLLLVITNSCSKDETEIEEEVIETNDANAVIDVIDGIDIATITINNGFGEISVTEKEFEINIQSEITSVFSDNDEIIYLNNKWLANSSTSAISSKSNITTEIELTARETAKAIIFEYTGMPIIDPSEDFANSMGYIMDNDPDIKKYVDQFEIVIKSDIKNNSYLTQATYEHQVLESISESMQEKLSISEKLIDWAKDVTELVLEEDTETQLTLNNSPSFLKRIRINGTTGDSEENFYYEKASKYGSINGYVLDITGATKNTNSYDVTIDFYNKTPVYHYMTQMSKTSSGNRVYSKDTLQNIITPYNSASLWKDLSSFNGAVDIVFSSYNLLQNGIASDNLNTTQSVKNDVQVTISEETPYLLLGNTRENDQLMIYGTIDLLSRFIPALLEFHKVSSAHTKISEDDQKENDNEHLKKVLVGFANYIIKNSPTIYARIVNLKNDIESEGISESVKKEIAEIVVDLTQEFFDYVNDKTGAAEINAFINEQEALDAKYGEQTNVEFLKKSILILTSSITLDNAVSYLGKAFPFFKVVKNFINIGGAGIDVCVFMLNNNPPVLEALLYLPFENETTPTHLEKLEDTKLTISFDEEINLQNTNNKSVFIRSVEDHSIVKTLTADELIITNNNKTLEIPINSINQGDYYVFIPKDFIFNSAGFTFQGAYTKDDWQYKVEDDVTIERTITLLTPQDNTEVSRDNNIINFSWDYISTDNTTPTKYKLTIAEYVADSFDKEQVFETTNKNFDVEISSFQTSTANFKWQIIAEDADENEWGASLVSNFTLVDNINSTIVTSVTPQTAILNTETTFTVTGENLTEGMGFWIADLNNITEITGGNSNERYFKGTPTNSIGDKDGVVKDASGGNTLLNFQITIEAQSDSGIYNGDVTLTTQQEVDDFGASNYSNITGSFNIRESSTIDNLSGLASITSVGGNLVIYENDALTSLSGLDNITSVGETLGINDNDALTSLSGLENITSVGETLLISNNATLTSLTGLENLTTLGGALKVGYLVIFNGNRDSRGNDALTNYCAISQLINNGQVTSSEYFVVYNAYNPTYEEIQNTGSGGCEE